MDLQALLLLTAVTGYGDVVDGEPSADERRVHLWTNAARVAPDAFGDEYSTGGCSFEGDFSKDEQTAKAPLSFDLNLNAAARSHSSDMADNGCFQHESCDGTDTWARIDTFYSEGGAMGENIAMGSGLDPRYAVLSMWMCSHDGHRANIMSGDFNELGTGAAKGGQGNYFTQDFAAGQVPEGGPAVRMGADEDGTFYADWGSNKAPASLDLVIDGERVPMTLLYGVAEQGIYAAEASTGDCSSYWFSYETADGESGAFPETGAYQTGSACKEIWASRDGNDAAGPGIEDEESSYDALDPTGDLSVVGCSTGGTAGSLGGLLLGLVAAAGRGRSRVA